MGLAGRSCCPTNHALHDTGVPHLDKVTKVPLVPGRNGTEGLSQTGGGPTDPRQDENKSKQYPGNRGVTNKTKKVFALMDGKKTSSLEKSFHPTDVTSGNKEPLGQKR